MTSPSSAEAQSLKARDLIKEYLAKIRAKPPAMFNPTYLPISALDDDDDDEPQMGLAYKHPILLLDDETTTCSVVSSECNEKNREVEVKYIDDNSVDLLDKKDEEEPLIVPKTKIIFHPPNLEQASSDKCRLVGKVNPNIIKTWEQLSGKKDNKSSLNTDTSSENSQDKQSCLIYYNNQFDLSEVTEDFRVNKIVHPIENSSDGDFYDSIDEQLYQSKQTIGDSDDYGLNAGEGLADFNSIDKKKILWSIDIE